MTLSSEARCTVILLKALVLHPVDEVLITNKPVLRLFNHHETIWTMAYMRKVNSSLTATSSMLFHFSINRSKEARTSLMAKEYLEQAYAARGIVQQVWKNQKYSFIDIAFFIELENPILSESFECISMHVS